MHMSTSVYSVSMFGGHGTRLIHMVMSGFLTLSTYVQQELQWLGLYVCQSLMSLREFY